MPTRGLPLIERLSSCRSFDPFVYRGLRVYGFESRPLRQIIPWKKRGKGNLFPCLLLVSEPGQSKHCCRGGRRTDTDRSKELVSSRAGCDCDVLEALTVLS